MKLEIGYKSGFEIRHEKINLPLINDVSIMFMSDLHFTSFSGFMADKLIKAIDEHKPSVILLGGDYIDTPGGFKHLNTLLGAMAPGRRVFAIRGNHDIFWNIKRIKQTMQAHGVVWLEKESVTIKIGATSIIIDGGAPVKRRHNEADISVLFVHKPADFSNYQDDYQLIFAGHLHGGQFVFWQTCKGLYPGRFLYKWNILEAHTANCRYFVSKGVGDTLPVRYNCKKDILLMTTDRPIGQPHKTNLIP